MSLGPIDATTLTYTALCQIQFSEGTDTMDFEGELGLSTSVPGDDGVSGDPTERNLRVRAALSAQLVLRGGWASADGPVREVAPPTSGPQPRRHREGLLFETHLYFPTGSSQLDDHARTTLSELVARMVAFSRAHTHARYAIAIEAHASPRWRGAGGDLRRAGELNDHLSEARANGSAAFINRAFLRANPDPSASHIDVLIGGQPRGMGALDAIQRGAAPEDDEWRDRRLDIRVYFREIQPGAPPGGGNDADLEATTPAPSRPAHAADAASVSPNGEGRAPVAR